MTVPLLPIELEPLAQDLFTKIGLCPYGGTDDHGRWSDSWAEKGFIRQALAIAYVSGLDNKETQAMKKIRPIADRILVRPSDPETRTPGGLIIPDNAKERPVRGEVLAVGVGRLLENGTLVPVGVKPGEVVLYGKYAGQDVQLEGVDHKILKEEDVLAVFTG